MTIPNSVIEPLLNFMTYTLKGAMHLNKLVDGCTFENIPMQLDENTKKRCRIVDRLSEGFTVNKKRRFAYSKLKHSLGDITMIDISSQVLVLEANGVVKRPSHRSVELVRDLPPLAQIYITEHCGFNAAKLQVLLNNNNL